MSKFWTVVTLISLAGVLLLATSGGSNSPVVFEDLETECRYDRGEKVDVGLEPENSISFQGIYPVENPDSGLDFDYRKRGRDIVLDIRSEEGEASDTFIDDCLGSVVYKAETTELEPGLYDVKVLHNGEQVSRRKIDVE